VPPLKGKDPFRTFIRLLADPHSEYRQPDHIVRATVPDFKSALAFVNRLAKWPRRRAIIPTSCWDGKSRYHLDHAVAG